MKPKSEWTFENYEKVIAHYLKKGDNYTAQDLINEVWNRFPQECIQAGFNGNVQ